MSATSRLARFTAFGQETQGASALMVWLRRVILFAGPLGVSLAMWFHPHAGEDVHHSLSHVADTFVSLHLLLFASLAVVGVGLYLMSTRTEGPLATMSRVGLATFGLFYLGYVAVVGVAKGVMIRESQTLSAAEQAGVADVVHALHTDSLLFAAGVVGAIGYLVAVGSLAGGLSREGAPTIPLVLLVTSTIAIVIHQGPIAVVAMAGLLVAFVWLEFGWSAREKAVSG